MNKAFWPFFFSILLKVTPLTATVGVLGYGGAFLLHNTTVDPFWSSAVVVVTTVFILAMILASIVAGYLLSHPVSTDDEEETIDSDTTQPNNPTL